MFGVRGRFQSFQLGLLRGCLPVSFWMEEIGTWRGCDIRPETQHGATEVCSDIFVVVNVMDGRWLSTRSAPIIVDR